MGGDDKKHPCPDCAFCQWCGEERCRLCRAQQPCLGHKLSLTEQIALYEAMNGRSGNKDGEPSP